MILLGYISSFIFLTLSFLIGTLLLPKKSENQNFFILSRLGIGIGILSYVVAFLLHLNLLSNISIIILLFLFLGLTYKFRRANLLEIGPFFVATLQKLRNENWINKGLFFLIFLYFFLASFEAMSLPTAADCLSYHLKIPKLYLEEGRIFYFPEVRFNMPHLLELSGLLSFSMAKEIGAQIHWLSLTALLAYTIFAFGREFLSRTGSLVLTTAFISTPMITDLKAAGYVEPLMVFFFLLGFWALKKQIDQEASKNDHTFGIIAAILLGLNCGVKYYAVLSVFPLLLSVYFYIYLTHKNYSHFSKFIFGKGLLIFVLFSSPFYLKNFIMAGNPVFPMGGFGRDWGEIQQTNFKIILINTKLLGTSFKNLLLYIWHMIMNGESLGSGRNGYGPLPIFLLPFLFLFPLKLKNELSLEKKTILKLFSCLSLLLIPILFYLAAHRARHAIILFFVLFLITIIIFEYFLNRPEGKIVKTYIILTYLSCIGFNFSVAALHSTTFIKYFPQDKFNIVRDNNAFWKATLWVNKNLINRKLFTMIDYNDYYLKPKHIRYGTFFGGLYSYAYIKNPQELANKLKSDGVDHILISESFFTQYDEEPEAKRIYMKKFENIVVDFLKSNGTLIKTFKDQRKARRTMSNQWKKETSLIFKI